MLALNSARIHGCRLTKSLELFDPAPPAFESMLARNNLLYLVKMVVKRGSLRDNEMAKGAVPTPWLDWR